MAASAPRFVGLDVQKQSLVVSRRRCAPTGAPSGSGACRWQSLSHGLRPICSLPMRSCWKPVPMHGSSMICWSRWVSTVTVAHPFLIKLIAQARVKTDRRDSLHLAKTLSANLIPAVWVPPKPVRELRAILAHRRRLIQQRTRARNLLHSMLHRHNLPPPETDPFIAEQRAWWAGLPLSAPRAVAVRQDLALLESLTPLIKEVEEEPLTSRPTTSGPSPWPCCSSCPVLAW